MYTFLEKKYCQKSLLLEHFFRKKVLLVQALSSYASRRTLQIFNEPNRYCIINNGKCDMCEKIEKLEEEIEQLKKK